MGTQEWPKPALPWCKGTHGGLTFDPIVAVKPTCARSRGQAWSPGAEELMSPVTLQVIVSTGC